ncbi:MAG TPA: serine hydrolase [Thermoanaerobaculales bacterium]|nr:serine hydrolase [Thermoanaerobaculales bacterium]HQN95030.1 serine hydrolase [Thermoanaerobaculales bacterium]HQP43185.1 serine hydrolase [Thermoanaerobaculales bacterium]
MEIAPMAAEPARTSRPWELGAARQDGSAGARVAGTGGARLKWWLTVAALAAVAPCFAAVDDATRDAVAELPHFVEEVRAAWGVPGVAVAVVRDGRVVYSAGIGRRDLESGGDITGQTVFSVGSATKAFTAAAIGMLVDEGAVNLDQPVRAYLPGLELFDEYVASHLTVRDLLAHRSGIERHDALWYRSEQGRQELLERLRFLRPGAGLRERFSYSNLMYMVAGRVVERVSGGTWEEFVQRRIFDPLGMSRSGFGSPPAGDRDVAMPHGIDRNGGVAAVPRYTGWAAGPAISIRSCADDLARWVQLLQGRGAFGGRRLLAEATVEEMFTPQMAVSALGPPEIPISSYGLGWFVESYRGRLMVSHAGAIDGFYSIVVLLPADRLGVVVLTNASQHRVPEVVSRWVVDRFLGLPEVSWDTRLRAQEERLREERRAAELAREAQRRIGTSPTVPVEALAGRYRHPAYGDIVIAAGDDGLAATFHGMTGPLEHFQDDAFLFKVRGWGLRDEFVVRFQYASDGAVASLLTTLEDKVPPEVFLRLGTAGGDPQPGP